MAQSRWWFLLAGIVALPWPARAQTVGELATAGRFAEAAASLTGIPPEEVDAGLRAIVNAIYRMGYLEDDAATIIRGVEAAKTIPNLTIDQREMLDFWHAIGIM